MREQYDGMMRLAIKVDEAVRSSDIYGYMDKNYLGEKREIAVFSQQSVSNMDRGQKKVKVQPLGGCTSGFFNRSFQSFFNGFVVRIVKRSIVEPGI